ncbi:phospholipase A-2-activating protein [Hysterangium stoloniferum]|nr:phospholipase A-2-activating protein [Hysterangium stoloniferum]
MPYKLSATLKGHSSDVRAVASPTANLVLSASRDTTAIVWNRNAPGSSFQATSCRAGSRYVNAVAYLLSRDQGFLVAGGQDSIITVFSLAAPKSEPDYSLIGHTDNVCTLNTGSDGTIISGSWDKTARVWKDFKCIYIFEGHSQAVWAVLVLEPGKYLTASADKTIKLWHEHKEIRTYNGHNDAVRGLALVSDVGFASCSNDSEIRVWTIEGDLVYSLSGHTSFIYSLSVLPTGEIVSAGEDRTVRVWRDGECSQTIVHPAISVWTVSTMPNGDIVSGTSDGIVRVFSESEERWASEVDLKQYEESVSSQALNKEQVGDLKQSDIKGPDALLQPGFKDGQVLIVREGSSVDAYQWSSSAGQWMKAGQVVDAVGSTRKQLYQGKEYDYVFDVDVQAGVPPLKLPYNASENPFQAAQRFLHANDLPDTYIDEVVKFIEKNTSAVSLGATNDYVDPYTAGASRYRGAGTAAGVGNQGTFVDPFTGASRYSGNAAGSPHSTGRAQESFVDPFTGSSRYSGVVSQAPILNPVLPLPTPLLFKQANVPAMRNKTYQLNDGLMMEISTSATAVSQQEMNVVDQAFDHLTYALGASSYPGHVPVAHEHVEVIMQIIDRWPSSQRFPVLDLARLLIAICPSAYKGPGQALGFLNALLDAAEWSEPWRAQLPKSRETNTLLALRGVANAIQVSESDASIPDWIQPIFERLLQVPYQLFTKGHRVVLATIAFNLSCIFLKTKPNDVVQDLQLRLITEVISEEDSDGETIYRIFAALGNMIHALQKHGVPIDVSQKQVFQAFVSTSMTKVSEERVKNLGSEILQLLA